jgi:hypothetical protein
MAIPDGTGMRTALSPVLAQPILTTLLGGDRITLPASLDSFPLPTYFSRLQREDKA